MSERKRVEKFYKAGVGAPNPSEPRRVVDVYAVDDEGNETPLVVHELFDYPNAGSRSFRGNKIDDNEAQRLSDIGFSEEVLTTHDVRGKIPWVEITEAEYMKTMGIPQAR